MNEYTPEELSAAYSVAQRRLNEAYALPEPRPFRRSTRFAPQSVLNLLGPVRPGASRLDPRTLKVSSITKSYAFGGIGLLVGAYSAACIICFFFPVMLSSPFVILQTTFFPVASANTMANIIFGVILLGLGITFSVSAIRSVCDRRLQTLESASEKVMTFFCYAEHWGPGRRMFASSVFLLAYVPYFVVFPLVVPVVAVMLLRVMMTIYLRTYVSTGMDTHEATRVTARLLTVVQEALVYLSAALVLVVGVVVTFFS